nr:MAG TPA_asm: hypothetical protein [Caudoviricetes sp.]
MRFLGQEPYSRKLQLLLVLVTVPEDTAWWHNQLEG